MYNKTTAVFAVSAVVFATVVMLLLNLITPGLKVSKLIFIVLLIIGGAIGVTVQEAIEKTDQLK